MEKTAFLITARLKSTRLPKKILLKVAEKPLIVHMLDRLKLAETINKIIICTSTNPQDNPLEQIAIQEGVYCFRGSEDDVLKRLLDAANYHHLPFFANITADCPLIDPVLVDWAIREHVKADAQLTIYDAANQSLPFNCYVIETDALEKIVNKKTEHDTEVWLKYFLTDNELKIHAIDPGDKYHHSALKTSIDYPEDYEFMKRIFNELYEPSSNFSLLDIIRLVEKNPYILQINANPVMLKRWKDHQKSIA
jgi:spore coat polysaccharide biosynthesis protein SpsF|tara:strand:+ start:380 stop:1132 length:753 start_codon:yes stop_codon:yes gene_type:complete